MPGRAKSQEQKHVIQTRKNDTLMARAVAMHRAEEASKPDKKSRIKPRKICELLMQQHFEETGEHVLIHHTRLRRLAGGGKTRAQAMAERSWLSPEQAEVVIVFIGQMAARGFPLSHRRLREHINMLARDTWGDRFPESGVGENYTHKFVNRYSDHIKMVTARPLEDKRAKAVNPATNTEYWKLLKEVVEKYNIRPETTFGVDEIGIQTRSDFKERVMASKSTKGATHQQRAGTRENTTVLVTICADGSSIPPAIIFKGSGYKVSWGENNPLNAS